MAREGDLHFARSPIGMADLVALVRRLEPDTPEQLFELARHLGYQPKAAATVADRPPDSRPKPERRPQRDKPLLPKEKAKDELVEQADRELIVLAQPRPPLRSETGKPQWLKAAELKPLEDTYRQEKSGPPDPLDYIVAKQHVRALLTTLLAEKRAARDVDIPRLVGIAASGEWIEKVPRLRRWRFARRIAVWIESNVAMAPLLADSDQFVRVLETLVPRDRLEIARFSTSLDGASVRTGGRTLEGLGIPEPGSCVLVLARFGAEPFINAAERLAQPALLEHLLEVAERGCRVIGLTPHEPNAYAAELRAKIQFVKWDERLSVSAAIQVRSGQWRRPPRTLPAGSVERLAALAALAVDVDQPLLRRLRRAFLPEADPSVEVDLWNGAWATAADRMRCTLRTSVLDHLRSSLDAGELALGREIVSEAHRTRAPVVQLEEEATFLALQRGPDANLEEVLGRVLPKLRDPSYQWLRSWASFCLQRLPRQALESEAARILGQVVPAGYGSGAVRAPTQSNWADWIGEPPVPAALEWRVWLRWVDDEHSATLELASAPLQDATELRLELNRDGELIVEDRPPIRAPLHLIAFHSAVNLELVRELSAALGESAELSASTIGATLKSGTRVLLVAPENWKVASPGGDDTPERYIDFERELARLRAAQLRLQVLHADGSEWVHLDENSLDRRGADDWRGPIEQAVLRALEGFTEPPRHRTLRLSTHLQRLSGLSGRVSLLHDGGTVELQSLEAFRRRVGHLVGALRECRSLNAYGPWTSLDTSGASPEQALTREFARSLLEANRADISSAALGDATSLYRARTRRLEAIIQTSPDTVPAHHEVLESESGLIRVQSIVSDGILESLEEDYSKADVVFVVPPFDIEQQQGLLNHLLSVRRRFPHLLFVPIVPARNWPTAEGRFAWDSERVFIPADRADTIHLGSDKSVQELLEHWTPIVSRIAYELLAKAAQFRRRRFRYPVRSAYTHLVIDEGDPAHPGDASALQPGGSWGWTVARRPETAFYRFQPRERPEVSSLWDPLAQQMLAREGAYWFAPPDTDFDWGADVGVAHPLERVILYELHVGTWWSKSGASGTFSEAMQQLPHLAQLGITGILLLPITQTEPGWMPWAPLTPSAISQEYGEPEKFKQFVRRAHQLGLAVYLGVVYTHVAPRAGGLVSNPERGEGLDPALFSSQKEYNGSNGPNWNFEDAMVRGMLIESALSWFRDFHVDGLYFDGLASFFGPKWSDEVPGMRFIRELVAACRAQYPGRLLFADTDDQTDWPGFDACVRFDFVLAFKRSFNVHLDDHRDLSWLTRVIERPDATSSGSWIVFSESFNTESGEGRLPRVAHGQPKYAARTALAAIMTLTASAIPCIRQGQELFEVAPLDLNRVLLSWSELANEAAPALADAIWPVPSGPQVQPGAARVFLRLYSDLISLRLNRVGTTRGLLRGATQVFHTNQHTDDGGRVHRVIAYRRHGDANGGDVLVVLNFSNLYYGSYRLGVPHAGRWQVRLDTSDYLGTEGDREPPRYYEAKPEPLHGFSHQVDVTLGRYRGLILSQDPNFVVRDWRKACADVEVTRSDGPTEHFSGYLVRPNIVATCGAVADVASHATISVAFGGNKLHVSARVAARHFSEDALLLELAEPIASIEPLPISRSPALPRTWEGVFAGAPVQGSATPDGAAWTFEVPTRATSAFAGAPLLSDGQVCGQVPQFSLGASSMLAVPARALLDLLEELFQMVKVGEVRLADQRDARQLRESRGKEREVVAHVSFEGRFAQQPQVIVSLQKIDVQDTTNAHIHRLWVYASNVTTEGFDLVFRTWKESLVHDAIAVWTAIGEGPAIIAPRQATRRAVPDDPVPA